MQSIIFLRRRHRCNVLNKIQIYGPLIIIIENNYYYTARCGNLKLVQLTSELTDCRYVLYVQTNYIPTYNI